jgi:uncharacterized protein YjbI with pentapeptide repeats
VGDEVRTLARARTLTILGRVDGARKRSVVQFLNESQLFEKDQAIVDLRGADLRGADLTVADLDEADLRGAILRGAVLTDADLFYADLTDADLSGVRGGTPEELEATAYSLSGATMPDGSTHP